MWWEGSLPQPGCFRPGVRFLGWHSERRPRPRGKVENAFRHSPPAPFCPGPAMLRGNLSRLDAHFYGPSPTTSTTGRRVMKTGEILAIFGNWLGTFVDHLGKGPHCVVVKRGRERGAGLDPVGTPSINGVGVPWRLNSKTGKGEIEFDESSFRSLNAYRQRSIVKSTKRNQAWLKRSDHRWRPFDCDRPAGSPRTVGAIHHPLIYLPHARSLTLESARGTNHVSGTGNDCFVCSSACSRNISALADHGCAAGKKGLDCAWKRGSIRDGFCPNQWLRRA